jgi:hypothetical protein
VRDAKSKKCTVTEKKPETTTETTVVGGDGVAYKTRTAAEGAMKTVKVHYRITARRPKRA